MPDWNEDLWCSVSSGLLYNRKETGITWVKNILFSYLLSPYSNIPPCFIPWSINHIENIQMANKDFGLNSLGSEDLLEAWLWWKSGLRLWTWCLQPAWYVPFGGLEGEGVLHIMHLGRLTGSIPCDWAEEELVQLMEGKRKSVWELQWLWLLVFQDNIEEWCSGNISCDTQRPFSCSTVPISQDDSTFSHPFLSNNRSNYGLLCGGEWDWLENRMKISG